MCCVRITEKQQLLRYTTLTGWFSINEVESVVFTVQYVLSPHIKQTHFNLKG